MGKKSPQRGLTTKHTNLHEKGRGRRAALGQAKLALLFQIPLQASLHGIVKSHRSLASRAALPGSGAAEDLGMRTDCGPQWSKRKAQRGEEIDKIIAGKIIGNHAQAAGRPLGRLPQGSPKGRNERERTSQMTRIYIDGWRGYAQGFCAGASKSGSSDKQACRRACF